MKTPWTPGPWKSIKDGKYFTIVSEGQPEIGQILRKEDADLIGVSSDMAELIMEWESSDCPSFDWEEKMLDIARRLREIGAT